jgi:hypothetical protein
MTRLIILIYSSLVFSTTVYVSGHLKNDPSNKKTFNVSARQIIVKADEKIVAKAKTDKKGEFKVNFSDDINIKSYSFYVVDSADTLFLKSFSTFDNETPEITLYVKPK